MLCPDTRKIVKFLTSVIMFVPSEKPSWADLVEEGEEGTAEIILLIESLTTCRSPCVMFRSPKGLDTYTYMRWSKVARAAFRNSSYLVTRFAK